MTPKEKAEQLVKKYLPNFIEQYDNHGFDDYDYNEDKAKECALIAVDECLESTKQFIHYYTKEDDERYADVYLAMSLSVAYWEEVKRELEKL